jgi:nitrite reductase/ring-hydroxylating ferredoxin subunit/uncharacterized membrane protein
MSISPAPHAVIDRITAIDAIDGPAKILGKKVRDTIPKGPVKDALSGTPLGHAFHPLMTDVPIGTWTSALLLDWLGGEDAEAAADRLIALGLAAAGPTFVSGWNDWADTEPASDGVRRVGIVHAVCNGGAATLFAASLASRKAGHRGRGKALGLAAGGLLAAGGWLGGHLSYAQGVGVDVTVFEEGPEEWTAALPDSSLPDGEARCASVAGNDVLLVRQGTIIHALADTCTHRGGALHEGEVGDGTITCPLHGSCFRLADGGVERGPAAYPQPLYDARVVGGTIEVRRRER